MSTACRSRALAAWLALPVALSLAPCALAQAPAGAEKVQAITVAPAAPTVFVGQTEQFAATVTYQDGQDLKLKPTWSLKGDAGTVSQDGLFTAGPKRAKGAVTATLGAKSATVEVDVVPYGYGSCHADGRIVYSVQDGGDSEYDLIVMDADGANPVSLTLNAADPPADYNSRLDQGRHGCWRPDGARIVFEAEGTTGIQAICVTDPSGSGRQVLLSSEQWAYYRPTFSPDGSRILLDRKPALEGNNRSPGDICIVNADGAGLVRLTTDPADEEDACWSPDGQRIAFCRARQVEDGVVSEIWVVGSDGANVQRLSPRGAVDYRHPAWSPDGSRIACTVREPGRNGDIAVIPAAGGVPVNLTASPDSDDYGPAWSWDGEQLLYATTDAPGLVREIWRMDAAPGAAPLAVTNRPDVGNYVRWASYAY